MEYKYLGNSGLQVSSLCFNNIRQSGLISQETYDDIIKVCLENGVNYFLTSNKSALGDGEAMLGLSLKKNNVKREELVLASIVENKLGQINNTSNRKFIYETIKTSLKRMDIDYLDIVYCHRSCEKVSIEELCRSMHCIVEKGLSFYWGTNEWPSHEIIEALEICEKNNWHKPIGEVCAYNMLKRDKVEKELLGLFQKHSYGLTGISPLGGGILSKKEVESPPSNIKWIRGNASRNQNKETFSSISEQASKLENKEKISSMFIDNSDIAEAIGHSVAQLSIAWVLYNNDVSSVSFGGSNPSHIKENIGARDCLKKMTPNDWQKIEISLGNAPAPPMNWKTWIPFAPRR